MSDIPATRNLGLAAASLLLLGVLALLLSGCDLSAAPTPVARAPTDAPPPDQPTAIPTDAEAPKLEVITLTVWTTETFSPTQTLTSGQILAEQAALFEASHPNVRLKFVLKTPHGKGGILDYLLTTKSVVPELLPDLVFIDVDELSAAVQAGLLQPLDDILPPDLTGDLYPFAKDAGAFAGQLYSLQYQADLDHIVYNTGKMTVPPSSWPGVLSNPGPYIFPAGGQSGLVNDAFIIQYLAVHPWSAETNPEEPFLDQESLVAVLQYYQDGVSRGIFPAEVLNYPSTDDCWRVYLAGDAAMSQVSAHRYLAERHRTPSAAAAIPAIDGAAAAIGRGWGLALVTSEPIRQSPAVEFMIQLMQPETLAAWNQAAGFLPTRQAALASRDQEDAYTAFIDQQLQAAQARPRVPNYTQIAAALQEAVESVLNGNAMPEQAAAQVIEQTK